MKINKVRGAIIFVSFLALLAMLIFENSLIALALSAICILAAIMMLYPNLAELTGISNDNPKVKTLKFVTIFDAAAFICCAVAALLIGTGVMEVTENGEKFFAACITAIIILVLGNIAPKLPFSKHTGLRLPWTVTDEDTWVVAHRIVGYVSLPLALVYIACIPVIPSFEILSLVVILLWIGIPGGLSYAFYYKKIKGLCGYPFSSAGKIS